MKSVKKLTAILFVVLLIFSMSTTAFATGTVYVRFYVPTSITQPTGYSNSAFSGFYEYVPANGLDQSTYNKAFLAIKKVAEDKGETSDQFVWGYDDHPAYGPEGFYISKLSGLGTYATYEYYSNVPGQSHWYGYSWALYVVPAEDIDDFTPANPDDSFLSYSYPSNVTLNNGDTVIMIYSYSEQTW